MPEVASKNAPLRFNIAAWRGQYPRFNLTDDQIQGYVEQSYLYYDDCCGRKPPCPTKRQQLRFLLVAHIAELESRSSSGAGMVGAITNASEGSVSIGTATLGDMAGMNAYFAQTPYGLAFWQATLSLRSAFYVPRRPNFRKISFP